MNFVPKIEFESGGTQTITFTLPPEGDFREQDFQANEQTTTSNNGVIQTQFNNTVDIKSINYVFVTESVKVQLDSFMTDHAFKGLEFKYFESEDEAEFITVTLSRKAWNPTIMFATSTINVFVYEFNIVMRELL